MNTPPQTHAPPKPDGAFWIASVLTSLISVALIALSLHYFRDYAITLFILIPLFIGMVAPVIAGFTMRRSFRYSIGVSLCALFFTCVLLIACALEGLVCMVMAIPITAPAAALGGAFGHYIQKKRWEYGMYFSIACFIIVSPTTMIMENQLEPDYHKDIRPVTTSIEIEASRDAVWNSVVEFPPLNPPDEMIFRVGIAYPIMGRIDGEGVGATRYCDFSTGTFVEPITVWNEPKHLAFTVEEQPIPMKELSPYGDIDAAHLHGYFVSVKGEFRLTEIGPNRTRLEGTTWYYQKIQPLIYWNLWADYIIHTTHRRVLNHIKAHVESSDAIGSSNGR